MNKIKIIYVILFTFLIVLIGATLLKIKHQEDFKQKTVLAQEINKGLVHLMYDLTQAQKRSIHGVPADGQWHDSVAFFQIQQGPLEYLVQDGQLLRISDGKAVLIANNIKRFLIRRQPQRPDILEVRLTAKKHVTLISNFRIRLIH